MDKAIKRQKELKPSMNVGVEAGVEAYGKTPTQKGVIHTGKKVYRPQLPYT